MKILAGRTIHSSKRPPSTFSSLNLSVSVCCTLRSLSQHTKRTPLTRMMITPAMTLTHASAGSASVMNAVVIIDSYLRPRTAESADARRNGMGTAVNTHRQRHGRGRLRGFDASIPPWRAHGGEVAKLELGEGEVSGRHARLLLEERVEEQVQHDHDDYHNELHNDVREEERLGRRLSLLHIARGA